MKRVLTIILLAMFALQSCAPRVIERNRDRVVVIKKVPRNHRIVVIKKKRYYAWDGNYYRKTSRGFVLVRL